MPALNKVILLGNLTRDPELRRTPQGTAVCSFGLAVNRRLPSASGETREETCFVDIEVWSRQAESCANYLRKGSPALIDGRLRMDQWDDRETGKRRTRLRVQADRVQFMGPPAGSEFGTGPADGAGHNVRRDTTVDAEGSTRVSREAAPEAARMPAFEPLPADEAGTPDDIPF